MACVAETGLGRVLLACWNGAAGGMNDLNRGVLALGFDACIALFIEKKVLG